MTEEQEYTKAVEGMNDRGRFKLANYMAHGYIIDSKLSENLTILKRSDKILAINKDGQLFVLEPAI